MDLKDGHKRGLRKTRATILLSGGIDSAACLALYSEQRFKIDALFVDYGQASARREHRAAKAISGHYRVSLRAIRLAPAKQKGPGLIRGRNAFLLLTALVEFKAPGGIIALGIHGGTRYSDCSPLFVRKMQATFDTCTGGAVQIGSPFLKWKKSDVWAFAKSKGVPTRLTYSCERGLPQPCRHCNSCRDLEILSASSLH
jgi:7-cyano-7-deazaguanine synthase